MGTGGTRVHPVPVREQERRCPRGAEELAHHPPDRRLPLLQRLLTNKLVPQQKLVANVRPAPKSARIRSASHLQRTGAVTGHRQHRQTRPQNTAGHPGKNQTTPRSNRGGHLDMIPRAHRSLTSMAPQLELPRNSRRSPIRLIITSPRMSQLCKLLSRTSQSELDHLLTWSQSSLSFFSTPITTTSFQPPRTKTSGVLNLSERSNRAVLLLQAGDT